MQTRRWRRSVVMAVAAAALSGCGFFGDDDLEAGSCLEFVQDAEGEVSTSTIDCDRPHHLEVIGLVEVDGFEEHPGDAEVSRWVFARCAAIFEDYVGQPYGTSQLDLDVAVPDEAAWDDGARTARCAVGNPDGSRRDVPIRS